MREHTKEYRDYLESFEWHLKREAALARAAGKCQHCGATRDLEVDHKHYDSLGHEQPEDLRVLCIPCHDRADEVRRRMNHRRAGLKTYAAKKYGESADYIDPEVLAADFDDWRERRSGF